MKRNLDLPILQLDGQPFKDDPTLGTVCFLAVTGSLPNDERQDGAQKMRLYGLAQKVHGGGVVDLTAEDVALLKERIGRAFTVLVVGRAYELLEADLSEQTA